MSRRQKCRLRELTPAERAQLEQISRAHAVPASHVARAKALLAVAAKHSYTVAAHQAGRRSGDAVAMLVARFNREGMAAVFPRQGGATLLVTPWLTEDAFLRKRDGCRIASRMVQRCGRCVPCGEPCARAVCPSSAPRRSGRCSGEPDWAGRSSVRGVRPARRNGDVSERVGRSW
jgi:hypothetical protein